MTKAESIHVFIKLLSTHLRTDPGQADIQGMLKASNHVLLPPRRPVPVAHHNPTVFKITGVKKLSVQAYCSIVQCSRHGKDLKNRTRFVGVADQAVKGGFTRIDL